MSIPKVPDWDSSKTVGTGYSLALQQSLRELSKQVEHLTVAVQHLVGNEALRAPTYCTCTLKPQSYDGNCPTCRKPFDKSHNTHSHTEMYGRSYAADRDDDFAVEPVKDAGGGQVHSVRTIVGKDAGGGQVHSVRTIEPTKWCGHVLRTGQHKLGRKVICNDCGLEIEPDDE